MLEQVCIAALDCNRIKIAEQCIEILSHEFVGSIRVAKLRVMKLEALGRFDDAAQILSKLLQKEPTNGSLYKRNIAILKAQGKINDAITELVKYLEK